MANSCLPPGTLKPGQAWPCKNYKGSGGPFWRMQIPAFCKSAENFKDVIIPDACEVINKNPNNYSVRKNQSVMDLIGCSVAEQYCGGVDEAAFDRCQMNPAKPNLPSDNVELNTIAAQAIFDGPCNRSLPPGGSTKPPVAAPARPPIGPPVKPPVGPPVKPPVGPPGGPPVGPPVAAPAKPPVGAPVGAPVAAPAKPPVGAPVGAPANKAPVGAPSKGKSPSPNKPFPIVIVLLFLILGIGAALFLSIL